MKQIPKNHIRNCDDGKGTEEQLFGDKPVMSRKGYRSCSELHQTEEEKWTQSYRAYDGSFHVRAGSEYEVIGRSKETSSAK